jgi:hypothetical protein
MHTKPTANTLRALTNVNSKKPKNITPLTLHSKPTKLNQYQLINTMLSEIKSILIKSLPNSKSNIQTTTTLLSPSTYDEFFNILIHIVSLNKQLSTKPQSIDSIITTAKTALTKEINSFFKDLPLITPKTPIKHEYSIEHLTKFSICDTNRINSFHLDFDEMDFLDNKNIIEKIKEKINSKRSKNIQVYKYKPTKPKLNNIKLIHKPISDNNNNISKKYSSIKYNGYYTNRICLTKPKSKPKKYKYPITRSTTPLKLQKRKVSKIYTNTTTTTTHNNNNNNNHHKKSGTTSKKNSAEKCASNLNGTFTNRKNIRKKTDSFSSDVDYSLNDSYISFTSDKMTKKFYSKYRIIIAGPKPSLYTNYLMNKSRDIIDRYHKEKKRQQKIDSYSFTDSYSHLFNIKRPQSTIHRSKRYFSSLFFGEK